MSLFGFIFLLNLTFSTSFAGEVPLTTLFHIVPMADWKTQSNGKEYAPPSLAIDGFIHLSTREQTLETASRFFKGRHDLLLLELSISSDDPILKFEGAVGDKNGRSGLFPHYYGKLKVNSVKQIFILEPNSNGTFTFPSKIYEQ